MFVMVNVDHNERSDVMTEAVEMCVGDPADAGFGSDIAERCRA